MDKKIKLALTQADATLVLESLAYRLMGLDATGSRAEVANARAIKREAIVAVMSALDSARGAAGPALSLSTRGAR